MWLQVVFLWLHGPAAAEMISPFHVFVESRGGAIVLFDGRTLPNSSPSPPVSTLLCGLSCRRSCRGYGPQHVERGKRVIGTPPLDVFDIRYSL